MPRTLLLAVALFAFAGSAVADCGSDHNAKETLTPDQQANASQVPAVAKNALPASNKAGEAKHAKKPVNKTSPDKVAANKVQE